MSHVLDRRRAGVLCHITSLPGGDLGADVERFLDLLAACGMSVWQVLPLNPPDEHHSPYCASSLFAGNPALLPAAFAAVAPGDGATGPAAPTFWLRDFAIFGVARAWFAAPWTSWPAPLRDRQPAALADFIREHAAQIALVEAQQLQFIAAWGRVRAAAAARGILLFGDLPLYPAPDSADVWAHRALFQLDGAGHPAYVAGVPPDYFSPTGQLWGNPVYDWNAHAADGYAWWRARLHHAAALFDIVRIDHFRGLAAYWRVPAGAPDASAGTWAAGPGAALFTAASAATAAPAKTAGLVAEDLGDITPDVDALRDALQLPGMRVLQFGFSGDVANSHLPAHAPEQCVYYTGTHDNDTTLGWYRALDAPVRGQVDALLAAGAARPAAARPMPWPLIDLALSSPANTAIVPLQDLLGLDGDHRMNVPGSTRGNWTWQFDWRQIPADFAPQVRELLEGSDRLVRPVGVDR